MVGDMTILAWSRRRVATAPTWGPSETLSRFILVCFRKRTNSIWKVLWPKCSALILFAEYSRCACSWYQSAAEMEGISNRGKYKKFHFVGMVQRVGEKPLQRDSLISETKAKKKLYTLFVFRWCKWHLNLIFVLVNSVFSSYAKTVE